MPGGLSSSLGIVSLVWQGLRACWRLKLALAVGVCITFCVPYFLLGHFPIMPVRQLPLTWLDRAIGFHPYEWIWIYQSEYLLVNAIPWLARSRDEVLRYTRGFALLALVSFVVFILVPIRGPMPEVSKPSGMYWLLQQYDAPYNSLPSLHAGMVVFTLAFGHRIFGRELLRGVRWFFAFWGALILYATLATKEHYVVDIVAGSLLGIVVDAWVWRRGRGGEQDALEQRPDVPRRLKVMVASADGIDVPGQAAGVAQQNPPAVVRAERG
jgi:membrane-associated phospholipid phosphatase